MYMTEDKKKIEITRKAIEEVVKKEIETDKLVERKRSELINLAKTGTIDKTVSYITRATKSNIEKM